MGFLNELLTILWKIQGVFVHTARGICFCGDASVYKQDNNAFIDNILAVFTCAWNGGQPILTSQSLSVKYCLHFTAAEGWRILFLVCRFGE